MDGARSCDATYDGLDAWMAWSFQELMSGSWSETDPWGRPLPRRQGTGNLLIADGYKAVIAVHRGDEKYFAKAYHLKTNWLSERICPHCEASRVSGSNLLYTLHGRSAPHRNTTLSLQQFLALCNPNSWVAMEGFHHTIIHFDILHVFDLSLVPDAAASVPGCARMYVLAGLSIPFVSIA